MRARRRSSARSRSATAPCWSCSTGRACGSARSTGLTLERVDLDRGRVLRAGQGREGARGPAVGLRRRTPSRPSSREGRATLARRGERALFVNRRRISLRRPRCPPDRGTIWRAAAAGAAGDPAHAAALVRDAPAGRRGRHPRRTGAAGARQRGHDPALHPRLPRPPLRGLRAIPPEGLMADAKKTAKKAAAKAPARAATKTASKARDEDAGPRRKRAGRTVVTIPPQVDDELGRDLARVQGLGRRRRARAADPALRAAREVRGEPRRDRPARERRAGRPRVATACSA